MMNVGNEYLIQKVFSKIANLGAIHPSQEAAQGYFLAKVLTVTLLQLMTNLGTFRLMITHTFLEGT